MYWATVHQAYVILIQDDGLVVKCLDASSLLVMYQYMT